MMVAFETAALALARPELTLLVTLDEMSARSLNGLPLREINEFIRPRLEQVTSILRRRYVVNEYVARIELSGDDRPHIHLLQWGSHIRADRFFDACLKAGLGVGKIQPVWSAFTLACYSMKIPLWALLLPEHASKVLAFDLELNDGQRFSHTSDFFRLGPGRSPSEIERARLRFEERSDGPLTRSRSAWDLVLRRRSGLDETRDPGHPLVLRVLDWVERQHPSFWWEKVPARLKTLVPGAFPIQET